MIILQGSRRHRRYLTPAQTLTRNVMLIVAGLFTAYVLAQPIVIREVQRVNAEELERVR